MSSSSGDGGYGWDDSGMGGNGRGRMGGMGRMGGHGHGGGMRGHGGMDGMGGHGGMGGGGQYHMRYGEMIHNLLNHHELIDRESLATENGIDSTTTSENQNVAEWIKTHVHQMKELLDSEDGYIREWDELFEAAFDLRDLHDMEVQDLDNGVRVVQFVKENVEGEERECAKAIIQAHAGVVDNFVKLGFDEAEKNHIVPAECDTIALE